MKILVWGINYGPEATGIAPYNQALCEFLKEKGHEVEMVTSFAYYPLWRKLPEDEGKIFRTDVINGVPVHRCWHYVPQKVSAVKRIIHEATFVCSSFLRVLFRPKADVMVVVSPALLLGAAAWLAGLLKRSPFVFHVQDLQPDAAIGLGMLKKGMISRVLYGLEHFAYSSAARVSGITAGMMRAFTDKGVPAEKRVYFPNPVSMPDPATRPAPGAFRARERFAPDDFLAVYSGNLGVKQGLKVLLDAAAQCTNKSVKVVICGDGVERETLAEYSAELNLKNVHFLPLQPRSRYEEMLVDADLCVITQQPGSGQFFFPSKMLTTLAYAKPVLAVADEDSDLALTTKDGNCGYVVAPGNPAALATALDYIASEAESLKGMGERGRDYISRFDGNLVMGAFLDTLEQVAFEADRARTRPTLAEAPVSAPAAVASKG
jgi:colanic acid biosynthesis glycosyl transferase WcaI